MSRHSPHLLFFLLRNFHNLNFLLVLLLTQGALSRAPAFALVTRGFHASCSATAFFAPLNLKRLLAVFNGSTPGFDIYLNIDEYFRYLMDPTDLGRGGSDGRSVTLCERALFALCWK